MLADDLAKAVADFGAAVIPVGRLRRELVRRAVRMCRLVLAEFPHAWIKSKCGLRQFRCRTRSKVACEVMFAALTYNLQRYMKLSSFINR